ncbi:AAA family ATPase [Erysipelotrichaceae bacterium 51-3]
MLKRIVYSKLETWKKDGLKKAVCLIGARQTGKSTVAREFGKNNYRQVIELNFIRHPEAKEIFRLPDPATIYSRLTALMRQSIVEHDTLLILDEIQECPEARTAVKFLVEDGKLDIIETGSLLGVSIQEVKSYPVGFERIIPMYPMTFLEFLWALNIPQGTIDHLKSCYKNRRPVDELIHKQMLDLFSLYMVIGGMPEAVQVYCDTFDLAKVSVIHDSILDLYRMDIQKYAVRRERVKILDIFDSIPGQLNAKNKRFKVAKIDKKMRTYQFEDSFLWLEAAGIALPCYNVCQPTYPLLLNEERNLFKLYLCDTGLLCRMMGGGTSMEILKGNIEINLGGVLENVFAQALKSRNFNLFYFVSKRNYELDFLVQNQSRIDLLEIKSGKYYTKHASLDKALNNPEWQFGQTIVFCKGNVQEIGRILYLPLYMVLFYEEEKEPEQVWKPDLSALLNFNSDGNTCQSKEELA